MLLVCIRIIFFGTCLPTASEHTLSQTDPAIHYSVVGLERLQKMSWPFKLHSIFICMRSSSSLRAPMVVLRHLFQDFTLADQQTFTPLPSGNTDIRFPGFPGPLTMQPITATFISISYPYIHVLHFICKANQVNLGTSAGWTGNNFHTAFFKSQCFQY